MNFNEWLNTLPGSPSPSQVAATGAAPKATVIRHADKGETTMEWAVKIARAYDVNEIQALIDMNFVDAHAVDEIGVRNALSRATNSQILAELDHRVDPEARRLFRGEGQDIIDVNEDAADATVFDFPALGVDPVDYGAVADRSPDHPEEDTDFD